MHLEPPRWVRSLRRAGWRSPTLDDAIRAMSAIGPAAVEALVSPAADVLRSELYAQAAAHTRTHFPAIELYAPIYVSNACTNKCTYCGFRYDNPIERVVLDQAGIVAEARALAATGIRSVLLVCGEAPRLFGPDDVARAVELVRPHFDRVAIEVFPMSEREYARTLEAGASGVTLYQETYDPERYRQVHQAGRKRNFLWRLHAPSRAARAGMREIGLGALLGLASWRSDAVWLAHHAAALNDESPELRLTVSFPRMREASGALSPGEHAVSDSELRHMMSALRVAMPHVGTVLSTREPARLRDDWGCTLATKMSAGSATHPGGYTGATTLPQFSTEDTRSPRAIAQMLQRHAIPVT